MRLLLDTNTFIWASLQPELLSKAARSAILSAKNQRLVSLASIWEMQIKYSLGKLPLETSVGVCARAWTQALAAELLPIDVSHIAALAGLPMVHKDPFDRMIATQALTEDATIVSSDRIFRAYPVKLVW